MSVYLHSELVLLFHLTNIPFFTAHACSQREDDPGRDWDLDTWFGQFVYKTESLADSAGNNEQRTRDKRTA